MVQGALTEVLRARLPLVTAMLGLPHPRASHGNRERRDRVQCAQNRQR
jgi:hypothetical protein